jgi:hypothetical protein
MWQKSQWSNPGTGGPRGADSSGLRCGVGEGSRSGPLADFGPGGSQQATYGGHKPILCRPRSGLPAVRSRFPVRWLVAA